MAEFINLLNGIVSGTVTIALVAVAAYHNYSYFDRL